MAICCGQDTTYTTNGWQYSSTPYGYSTWADSFKHDLQSFARELYRACGPPKNWRWFHQFVDQPKPVALNVTERLSSKPNSGQRRVQEKSSQLQKSWECAPPVCSRVEVLLMSPELAAAMVRLQASAVRLARAYAAGMGPLKPVRKRRSKGWRKYLRKIGQ